jgi:hypothetical protein
MASKTLEQRIQRLEDIQEIQNLMSKYCYLQAAGMRKEEVELFARNTPGGTVTIANWGVWEGFEGAKICYEKVHALGGEQARIGSMAWHTLTTPVIEVAGDGKTAKGLWISPGADANRRDGTLRAYWCWGKYGVDFVKEDGKWKFWHFHVYAIFYPPYDKSWVDVLPTTMEHPLPDGLKSNRMPVYHWEYSPNVKVENIPAPPEPYETWDRKSMSTDVY